jgi:hypothetical protein
MRRWLLAGAIAVYFAATLLWLAGDRRVPQQAFDKLSSANTSDEGVSLAYQYLARRGASVERLTRPVESGAIAENGVVFRLVNVSAPLLTRDDVPANDDDDDNLTSRAKPKKKPVPPKEKKKPPVTPLLSDNEEEWVRHGGRLILGVTDHYGPLEIRGTTNAHARKAFPIWPGVDEVVMPQPRVLAGNDALRRTHALFVAGDDAVIARQTIGAGELILIAAPEMFANGVLANGSHLALLEQLAGAKRPVYFDEFVHGLAGDAGVIAMLKDWNLGPFLLLLLVIGAAIFWRGGRAVGEREDDHRETRSDAIDLVASLGALYDRSMTDGEALELYHRELTRAVAASTGLRGDALHKRVADLTAGIAIPRKHDRVPPDVFRRTLHVLNDSFRRIEHAKHS